MPEEALSQAQRQAANEWYDHSFYSRLNDKLSGAIVLIMHRLHEDDLAGHVLAQEEWEVVRLPAIADEDERHRVETVFGRQVFGRRAGEALHPEREPREMLEQLRRTIGEYNFAGQYQQAPTPLGGGMVKAAWFKSYAANERPEKFDHIVQSWDTANKASELSDFSVCTSAGIRGKDLYLLHVLRRRMEYPELSRTDGPDASTSARAARRGKCSDRVSMTAHGAYPPLLQRSTNAGNCFKCGRRKSRGQDWRSASSTRCPRQHARAWLRRCVK